MFYPELLYSRSPPPPPISASDDEDEEETQEVTSTGETEMTPESNLDDAAEAPATTKSTKVADHVPEVMVSEDKSTSEAAATMLELGGAAAASEEAAIGKDGNTYLLVVDESNQLGDQLNSQTFYIDSNSLANGDLSHMVLTESNGQHQLISTQDATAAVDSAHAEQPATTTEDK